MTNKVTASSVLKKLSLEADRLEGWIPKNDKALGNSDYICFQEKFILLLNINL